MGTISRQYSFVAGAVPSAANWNADPNNFITLVNGQIDEANVDHSSADGIATLQNTQTLSGAKTFSSSSGTAFNYGVTINEGSNDSDTRIETNNMTHAVVVDAGLDAISFGAAAVDDSFVQIAKGASTSTATQNTYHLSVAPGGATTIPSGTTAYVGSVNIAEPNITATGTVTNAFTVRIAGAPTEGSTTNYALWVDAGATQLDGALSVGVDDTGADVKFFGATSGKYMLWDESADALLVSGSIDMVANGNRIDLDTDNDTSIRASADDTISIEVAGADDFTITANSLNVLTGSVIDLVDNAPVQFGDADDASIKWDASNLAVSAGTAAVNITAGDLTVYDDNNNADVSLTMGTGSAESLAIQVLNGSSNKTAEEVKFVTATASGTANHGKMTFNVDGTDIISIDDGGIDMLANGNQLTLDTDGDTSIRASADDQIDFKVGTGDVMKLVAAGGASPKLTLTAAATSHSSLMDFAGPANGGSVIGIAFVEGDADGSANNMKYQFAYVGGGDYISLDSWNTDGSAGRADIFRVPDGQLSIDANTTWDANVFDYVCSSDDCGWHDAHEVDECPLCGSDVEWHDDADLLDRALHLPAKRNDALATLERLGVINTYGTLNSEKPEVFTSLPNAHMFTFSAVAQLHRRISELERKIA